MKFAAWSVLLALVLPAARPVAAQTERLGHIDFPASGAADAQPHFVRGVLYLHSFEYADARRAFREAQRIDPGFAMAYWGEAMTHNHPIWFGQDREAAQAILTRLGPTPEDRRARTPTERERGYLEAVEILFGDGPKARRDTLYMEAMGRLARQYPDDHEAASFYALSILGTSHGGRDMPTYMRAAEVVERVFAENPNHPGAAHYLIHAYDDPISAPRGLPAARAYSEIAPDAAHAQHMTTHIFVAMGMWDEVVSQNTIASEQTNWGPGHYTHWLGYGFLQQGRFADALAHLEDMRRRAGDDTGRVGAHFLRMAAEYVVNTERWESPVLAWPVERERFSSWGQMADAFMQGYAAAHRGDRGTTERSAEALEALASATDRVPAVLALEIRALLHLAAGRSDEALSLLRHATTLEDGLPFDFGPPDIIKPAHELLGETLLALNQPAEAKASFARALELAPKRWLSLRGLARAAAASGDRETAAAAYRTLREIWHRADPDLPELAEASGFVATR